VSSKRVTKLAGEFVTKMLAEAGVTKSAGSTAAYMPYAVGLAEAVVTVEDELKSVTRRMERHVAEVGRLIDVNGANVRMLAERYAEYAGVVVPGVEKVRQNVVDLDLEKFGVQLAERKLPDDEHQPWYPGHSVNPEHDGN